MTYLRSSIFWVVIPCSSVQVPVAQCVKEKKAENLKNFLYVSFEMDPKEAFLMYKHIGIHQVINMS
jgi:hypothetical protein